MTAKRAKLSFQRRDDSTSGHHCCVPGCTASAKFNSVLSFHTFPKDLELQNRWMVNIRRDDFPITNHTRVCSRHFQSADLIEPSTPIGRRRLKNGAVPLLFQWNNFTEPAGTMPRGGRKTQQADMGVDMMRAVAPPTDAHHPDHDYCRTTVALHHAEDLRTEIARLREQMEEIVLSNKFGLERFAASDDDIRFYTRFASHSHLMAFWRQIEPATHSMVRVNRGRTAPRNKEVPHTAAATVLFFFSCPNGIRTKILQILHDFSQLFSPLMSRAPPMGGSRV